MELTFPSTRHNCAPSIDSETYGQNADFGRSSRKLFAALTRIDRPALQQRTDHLVIRIPK